MTEDAALQRLPTTYAMALRMRADGRSETEIANGLGIEREAVGPLLQVADAKLEAITDRP
jgi:DNA-directed RNA polymerase specialized sigma24 family protein